MVTSLENWYLANALANMAPKSTVMIPDMPHLVAEEPFGSVRIDSWWSNPMKSRYMSGHSKQERA